MHTPTAPPPPPHPTPETVNARPVRILLECILVDKIFEISSTPSQISNKAEPTLALKPRGDVTRSPKQGYHKVTCVQQKLYKKKKLKVKRI